MDTERHEATPNIDLYVDDDSNDESSVDGGGDDDESDAASEVGAFWFRDFEY